MAKRIIKESHRQSTRIEKSNTDHSTRYYSKKQEDSVAEKFNGNRVKNSGATMFQKGDVTLDNFLIECKTKTSHSDSISVKKAWIDKNKEESLFMGKPYSAIAFNFGPGEENYYIVDEELFLLLSSTLQNLS